MMNLLSEDNEYAEEYNFDNFQIGNNILIQDNVLTQLSQDVLMAQYPEGQNSLENINDNDLKKSTNESKKPTNPLLFLLYLKIQCLIMMTMNLMKRSHKKV